MAKQDFKKGAYHLARALQILDKHGSVNRGELLTGNLQGTWELLAMCHYQNGDLDQCVKCCTALLKADRYLMSTLVMMLCAFKLMKKGMQPRQLRKLMPPKPLRPPMPRTWPCSLEPSMT